jgi:uncharacterized protein YegL
LWFKNTNNDRNVYLLLDRSGSMASQWESTLESINGYVKRLEDDVNVYVAAFDSGGGMYALVDYLVLRQTTAKKFENISITEVSPRGGTPLFDAAGRIMTQMINDNPEKAVLVVMTDGEENSSREFTHQRVMDMLKTLETKKWPVVYLGAGFKEVSNYAFSTFNLAATQSFNTTNITRNAAMGATASKTHDYFSTGDATVMSYSEEEKAAIDNGTYDAKIYKNENKPKMEAENN